MSHGLESPNARPDRYERFFLQGLEGELLPRRPAGFRDAALLLVAPAGGRNQQHLLPDAAGGAAPELGGAGARRFRICAEGDAADHPPEAAERRGGDGLVLPTGCDDPGRSARPGALPAAAEPEEGRWTPDRFPGPAPADLSRGVRVSTRVVVRRRGAPGAVFGARRSLLGGGRRARRAARVDGRVGVPAPAPLRLLRGGPRRLGGANPRSGVERGLRLLQARGRGNRASTAASTRRFTRTRPRMPNGGARRSGGRSSPRTSARTFRYAASRRNRSTSATSSAREARSSRPPNRDCPVTSWGSGSETLGWWKRLRPRGGGASTSGS